MDYNSPQEISKELERRGLSPQKRFGQNFMINASARSQIVDLLEIGPGQIVWEIGPGLGALTVEILARGAQVRVFEIDRGYVAFLQESFGANPQFIIVEGDARKQWPHFAQEPIQAIIGNLPYNVASGMIAEFLEQGFIHPMVFTIQKEVAQRMRAKPGDSDYGSFSVFCQTFCTVTVPMVLRPGSFYPAPEVTSAVVKLLPRNDAPALGDRRLFDEVLRAFFASRRKTIANNLKQSGLAQRYGLDVLHECAQKVGIRLGDRSETLAPEIFAQFSIMLLQSTISKPFL
jgi:16S rRNA (adenine1518-N6/adenine1519-N6)-dimethyltransferase